MEDFHDTLISKVEGVMVGLFGVFDGKLPLAVEQLDFIV